MASLGLRFGDAIPGCAFRDALQLLLVERLVFGTGGILKEGLERFRGRVVGL